MSTPAWLRAEEPAEAHQPPQLSTDRLLVGVSFKVTQTKDRGRYLAAFGARRDIPDVTCILALTALPVGFTHLQV